MLNYICLMMSFRVSLIFIILKARVFQFSVLVY